MDDLRERLAGSIRGIQCDRGGKWNGYIGGEAERTVDRMMAELAKTHRLVKLGDGPHGTYSRYTSGRCRCDLCREANRDYVRRYRRKIKERNDG